MQDQELKRSLSLPLMTFYGLGTILGAGIYVLVGKVSAVSAMHMPLSFLLASFIAIFTGISYAELSSRFPYSAGEAYYVNKAFGRQWLTSLIGWLVVFTGIVSSATLANGFVAYASVFFELPAWLIIIEFVVFLSLIAIWGILESAMLALIITLAEVGGLLLVVYAGFDSLHELPARWREIFAMGNPNEWGGIFSGAFLAFYAFIGFEDMVNVAEEVKSPQRNLPLSIFLAVFLATVLYVLVGTVSVLTLPLDQLTQHQAPLAALIESKGYSPEIIGAIGLVAILNGALVQIIMASRVIYGLGKLDGAPKLFSRVSLRTKTPIFATVLVSFIILCFALWLPLETLAKTTSAIILCVFTTIHLALLKIKLTTETPSDDVMTFSIVYPIIGAILSALFLLFEFVR